MKIDRSHSSSGGSELQSNKFEYEYHSAEKVNAAIETSMQSYSQAIKGRHLGKALKTGHANKGQVNHTDEDSSIHDKDDIVTNGYGGTNRLDQMTDAEHRL
jgi:hypothetical protein